MRTHPANQAIVDAVELRPAQASSELTPDSIVTILFRGGPPIADKFNSQDYIIPPIARTDAGQPMMTVQEWQEHSQPAQYFKIPYGVATHLRERNIVPGSRNPHNGKAASQLAIVLTPNGKFCDPPERQAPFTEEQLKRWGCPESPTEGIDRTLFEDNRKNVRVVDTTDAVMAAYRGGTNVESTLSADPEEGATAPPEDHEGLREASAATRDAQAANVQVSTTRRGQTRFKDNS